MGDEYFPEKGSKVLEDALGVKIATMLLAGSTRTAIAKTLKISVPRVNTLMNTQECIDTIRKLEQEGLSVARSKIRLGVAQIADKVLKVINQHLDEGNLQAIAPALKILGISEEQPEVQDTNIVVMLPGSQDSKIINVTEKDK